MTATNNATYMNSMDVAIYNGSCRGRFGGGGVSGGGVEVTVVCVYCVFVWVLG